MALNLTQTFVRPHFAEGNLTPGGDIPQAPTERRQRVEQPITVWTSRATTGSVVPRRR